MSWTYCQLARPEQDGFYGLQARAAIIGAGERSHQHCAKRYDVRQARDAEVAISEDAR